MKNNILSLVFLFCLGTITLSTYAKQNNQFNIHTSAQSKQHLTDTEKAQSRRRVFKGVLKYTVIIAIPIISGSFIYTFGRPLYEGSAYLFFRLKGPPRNLPSKYNTLEKMLTNIQNGKTLTRDMIEKWSGIYNQVHDYSGQGWYIPEDQGGKLPFGSLHRNLYKLLYKRKITYADESAKEALISYFVSHYQNESTLRWLVYDLESDDLLFSVTRNGGESLQ